MLSVPSWKLCALNALLCWREEFPSVDEDIYSPFLDISPGDTSCPSKQLLAGLARVCPLNRARPPMLE